MVKDLLSIALPTRVRPSFTHSQSLPSGSFHKPLLLIQQRADRRSKNFCSLQNKSHSLRKLTKLIPWITSQWNYEPCRAGPTKMDRSWWRILTKCGRWEGNGKPLQYSHLMNTTHSLKRQKGMTPEDEGPGSLCVSYATGEEKRNCSTKNEEAGPKQKWCSAIAVSGGESKIQCCKEEYCIETWNVRSMNQAEFDMVKQEIARVNINILGISELKWDRNGQI